MQNRLVSVSVFLLLSLVFSVCVLSIKDDSLTMDELAHLPAGYSYLSKQDMRLNPEHPPIIKDLAAFPLLFLKNINFPSHIKSWEQDVNGQWDFGNYFLFKSNNPADRMIFWGRIPMIIVLVLTGLYTFLLAKKFWGEKTAMLSLFLFAFSPTLLAHGRLVTTDVGVTAGIIISTYYFLIFLDKPNKKNVLLAGLSFGIAQLTKFTAVFLIPYFVFLVFARAFLEKEKGKESKLKKYFLGLVITFSIGVIIISSVYQYHVLNYPMERQARDIDFILSSHPIKFLRPVLVKLSQNKISRPLTQYLFGLSMVFQRGISGNTTYFLGQVSALGWKSYFPILYLVKEPISFHILTILTLLVWAWNIKRPFWQNMFQRIKKWLESHFNELALLSFIFLYWAVTLSGNLNIGVRHIIPVLPLTIILVSIGITKNVLKKPNIKIKYSILGILLLWQAVSVISVYPHFLSYFNELVGGPKNGRFIAADSNLDWGQDLKRLKKWTDENKIDKIYIDYFGGADVRYYFQEKYLPWNGSYPSDKATESEYLAVSGTLLMGGQGEPVQGFDQDYGYYLWLNNQELVTSIGNSIFVYHIK